MLSNGYAQAMLARLADITDINNPQTKITPTGLLESLIENNPSFTGVKQIKTNDGNGGNRVSYKLRYMPRYNEGDVSTTDDCDVEVKPQWLDHDLNTTATAKFGIYISLEDMAQYVKESTGTVSLGGVSLMDEHIQAVVRGANGILGKMNKTLINSLTYGKNVNTGNNTAVSVNISQSKTVNILTDGITKILADASDNEMNGDLIMFGSGLFNNYAIQQGASGLASNGIDTSRQLGWKWYNDTMAASATGLGANKIGVYSKGSLGFVDLDKYVGFYSGRIGTSTFFQITLPVQTRAGIVENISFNAQLKEIDCPTTLDTPYSTINADRGYALYLTKQYGLFQIPSDAYNSNDRLTGNNGLLRYTITNS